MTTPIDELAGPEEPTTEAGRTLIADWGAGLIGELDLHTITDRIAAIETEARSTPVPASNVSEGLREAVERYIVAMTRRASGGTTDAEVQAAYAALYDAAAPERLEPTWCVSEGLREALLTGITDHARVSSSVVHCDASCADSILVHAGLAEWRDGRAALAHAAPEGLDAERLERAIARYYGPWGARTMAEKIAADLSQPDATDEAGR